VGPEDRTKKVPEERERCVTTKKKNKKKRPNLGMGGGSRKGGYISGGVIDEGKKRNTGRAPFLLEVNFK